MLATLGYIVTNNNRPLMLDRTWPDGPKGGVLCRGNSVTLFEIRKDARRAIERTRRYVKQIGYQDVWDDDYLIYPLKEEC
jgi:hypothetical protein